MRKNPNKDEIDTSFDDIDIPHDGKSRESEDGNDTFLHRVRAHEDETTKPSIEENEEKFNSDNKHHGKRTWTEDGDEEGKERGRGEGKRKDTNVVMLEVRN